MLLHEEVSNRWRALLKERPDSLVSRNPFETLATAVFEDGGKTI